MKHTLIVLVLIALVLTDLALASGCGLFSDDEDTTAYQLRVEANGYRESLNVLSYDARDYMTTITAACAFSARLPALKAPCSRVGEVWRALNAAWLAAWSTLDVYEAGLGSIEVVRASVARVRDAVAAFGALLSEVSSAQVDPDISEGGGSAPAPAAAEPEAAPQGAAAPAEP